jgi:hypothetical protein
MNNPILILFGRDGSIVQIHLEEGQDKNYVTNNLDKILKEKREDPENLAEWKVVDVEIAGETDPKDLVNIDKPPPPPPSGPTLEELRAERMDMYRSIRERFFSTTDYLFLRNLESNDEEDKQKTIKYKKHLRDLPNLIKEWGFQKLSLEELRKFNPFGNIVEIEILNRGSGYLTEPNVTFSEPLEVDGIGRTPVCETKIENGEVIDIIIIDPGCGYGVDPKVTITDPESPNGVKAEAIAKQYFFIPPSELEDPHDNQSHLKPFERYQQ